MTRSRRSDEDWERGRSLGSELQKARGKKKAADVAAESGISIDTLRKLERGGVADPGFFLVGAVARALRVRLDTLEQRSRRKPRSR